MHLWKIAPAQSKRFYITSRSPRPHKKLYESKEGHWGGVITENYRAEGNSIKTYFMFELSKISGITK